MSSHITLMDMGMLATFKSLLLKPLMTVLAVVMLGFGLLTPALAESGAESTAEGDSQLEALFDALSQTKNADDAQIVTLQIWERWITDNGDATNISMMRRGIQFMDSGNLSIAEEVFSRIINRDNSYTEAWNKRATVRYLLNNLEGSEQDIYEVLIREPRHFGAMSGLCLIKMQQGKLGDALTIYKDILKIHPNSPDAVRMVPKLEGILKGSPA